MQPLFQEIGEGQAMAFSAAGYRVDDGRVTMLHVTERERTNCDLLRARAARAACWNNVGLLLGSSPDAAAAQYTRAVAAAVDDSAAHCNLALVLAKLGRTGEAAAAFASAAALNPQEAVIWRAYGRMHEEAGRADDAERVYREAVHAGVWNDWQQRAQHIVPALALLVARAWHWPTTHTDQTARVVGEWVRVLEENFPAIRQEALAVAAGSGGWKDDAEGLTVPDEQCAAGDGVGWSKFVFWRWSYPNQTNLDRCPVTAAVLRRSSGGLDALANGPVSHVQGMAEFSRLLPGTVVKPHTGRTNTRLRIHLPLVVPPGDLGIEVAGEARRWQEGRCLAFDDSFTHRAWHRGTSSSARLVLIVDIWAPGLASWEDRWRSIDIAGRRRRFEQVARAAGLDASAWKPADDGGGIAAHLNDAAEFTIK